ncbi:MAG: ATP-binding protein [Pseudomonadota bacterium]
MPGQPMPAASAFGMQSVIRANIAVGAVDRSSLVAAAVGGIAFGLLAYLSVSMTRFEGPLATIWLPDAAAVAFLLRARLKNEVPFLCAIFLGSIAGDGTVGFPAHQTLVFSAANILDVVVVTILIRHFCGWRPNMANINHLASFALIGGLIGPLISATVASTVMGQGTDDFWRAVSGWFLTDGMGMILIVPTTLLVVDAILGRSIPIRTGPLERAIVLVSGLICAYLVFDQPVYPLLFLIPPITLLHAFRLGPLGTALFIAMLALLTTSMTWAGHGPIVQSSGSAVTQMQLLQAFVAANFLTGLPVAAILEGRERATERLKASRRELIEARRSADNAAKAKTEFLANMSHEIRTPMNGVLGFAELMLQSDCLDPSQRRQTELIVQSGRSMMMLLNDILDLSKIEAGEVVIDPTPVNIDAILAECAALHRIAAEEKGLELRFSGSRDPQWLITDALRLRQIALNLIGNAVKFTESGHITVSYSIECDEVIIRVVDTGIGIHPDTIEHIFQPFVQGENDTERRFEGTGLGLSISSQLAARLGGSIKVASEPGTGSCFALRLPFEGAEAPAAPPSMPPAQESKALPPPANILLAEDHDVNRLLMIDMLERCGQSVSIAHDGHEAIAMVVDAWCRGEPYELVLMDVQMPACDGYSATRAIRAEGIGPNELPIVALTANAFPEDIAATRKAGMQAHLAKPLAFGDLVKALQRWLPTRIVDQGNHLPAAQKAEPSPAPSQLPLSPKLIAQWEERRSEMIDAIATALNRDGFDCGKDVAFVRLIHKLAGTAAVFGEPDLGTKAADLDLALRESRDIALQRSLAQDLLAIAAGRILDGERSNRARG